MPLSPESKNAIVLGNKKHMKQFVVVRLTCEYQDE
jgi:hypothetical protein